MKTNHQSEIRSGRAVGLVIATILLLTLGSVRVSADGVSATNAPSAKAADTGANLPEPGEFNNSVTVGGGYSFVNGDKAQYMRQSQRPGQGFGGIEELHFEEAVGKRGLFQIDGRGIYDNHDYDLKLGLSNPDIGYLRGGYRESRTWYDGSGGFSPRSNAWVTIYDEEFFVDRKQGFFEAGLTLPDWPVFTVRYTYDARTGMKDSTIWGDYNLTQTPASAVLRGIIPTFRSFDERRHILEADMKHTIKDTTFGVGMRYERDEIDNSLNIQRRQGEPTLTRKVTQTDSTDADIYNGHAFVETRLHPKVLLTMGGSYTRLDTDVGGSRIYGPFYGAPFDPLYANRQERDEGYTDLSGGARVDQYVANLNLMLTPWPHVTIVPSLRLEHQDQVGLALFTETRVITNAPPATNVVATPIQNNRLRNFTDVTEALDLRYTGFTNWALYARGEWLEGQGGLKENEFDVEDDGSLLPVNVQRDTHSDRLVQKYTVGANWYPHRKVNFGAQYYYRNARNDYDHNLSSTFYDPPPAPVNTNNLYPAFMLRQQFETHNANFRMTFRPWSSLTLVSRYDYQVTSYDMRGGINSSGIALPESQSAEATSHIFSQSASWTPLAQLYLQGSVSYAIQHTDSPAGSISTGTASNLTQNARNNYFDGSAMIGYAFTKWSDLQLQYNYYRADNFDVGNASVGLPLGASMEQHGVTVTLVNRLRKNLIWKIQYGFSSVRDQTSGGNNNFDAHLVYSSVQYLF